MSLNSLSLSLSLFSFSTQGHEGCVNCIEWNYPGTMLCSVSDDCNIILWDPFKKKKISQFHSNHTGNIFAAKFLEFNHENLLVTAAADSKLILHDLCTHSHLMVCDCHRQRVKKLATTSHDSNLFWSAGEDGLVLQTDIRTNHVCNEIGKLANVLIDLKTHSSSSAKVTSIACNPVRTEQIAVGSNDQFVRLYDRRMIRPIEIASTADNLPTDCVKYFSIGNPPSKRKYDHALACTNLSFSRTGDELLANISSDHIYLFNILNVKKPKIFSTNLSDVFGPLADEGKDFSLIDDCSSPADAIKRLKTSNSNISQSSNSSSSSSVVKQHVTKAASNPTTSSLVQQPSTSRCVDNELADDEQEMEESIEEQSRQLIDRINRQQRPHLASFEAKAKLPKHIAPLFKSASSLAKKEKYSDAIEVINEAISQMPNVSRFYCLRGNCYLKRKFNNDLYCALRDYYRSLEIDPNNKESHLKLAQCLYEMNYFDVANKCLSYFRENQSKDTRYKQYKELEKLVTIALKDGKKKMNKRKKKKFADAKKKNDSQSGSYGRKLVENLSLSYFTIAHNNSNNSGEQPSSRVSSRATASTSSDSWDSSSSSSSGSLSDLSFDSEFNGHTSGDDDERSRTNHDHLFEMFADRDNDSDSDVPRFKRVKSKKELQWRTEAYDFDQRFVGHCNVSTDIMEASFFGR